MLIRENWKFVLLCTKAELQLDEPAFISRLGTVNFEGADANTKIWDRR